ncbi:hypothetical protein [Jiangella mangrovi]|uniref:Uncharacterized protein n=1 Tax=Jiangella mangrovi TaxID=1524084 RepID=A0A7W9LNT8_9ACTN|nr:hypothetical protein [Jiangella mangrovi]MBB5790660.1 hypothetical protein [Jiangella mangrovi]
MPAAQAAGIDIMVYIVPPSECFLRPEPHLDGRCSRPFDMDYVAWARAIAELSVEFPNVKSWGIDDFLSGPVNQALFTPEYLAEVRAAQDAVNPDLKWYVTLYHGEINPESMERIDGALDGVIYPYNSIANTIDPTELEYRLDTALEVTQPAGQELVLLVYNGRFLDGIIHPDERYAAEVLDRAEPYVRDGRITGVIAYAGPIDLDKHAPSWDHWGHTGYGSLSLSVSNFVSTANGAFASASQVVAVDPAAGTKTLSFRHHDPDEGGLTGYQFKQVLVNGEVVWNQDIVGDARDTWIDATVDLTDALAGLTEATVTFRLYHQTGIGWWPHDLRIDDVTGSGLTVVNGGFETPSDWTMNRSGPNMQPYIDVYHPDRPTRVFNEISAGYARYQGLPFAPVRGGDWPSLRTSPENRAMYGNGRLEFTVPANTPVPAGTCASVWQQVDVEPGLPRYEIDFWHADPYQVKYDQYFKQILIDGDVLWDRDAGDWWPWFYMQGSEHQGAINATEFVQGKDSVKLEFRFLHQERRPGARHRVRRRRRPHHRPRPGQRRLRERLRLDGGAVRAHHGGGRGARPVRGRRRDGAAGERGRPGHRRRRHLPRRRGGDRPGERAAGRIAVRVRRDGDRPDPLVRRGVGGDDGHASHGACRRQRHDGRGRPRPRHDHRPGAAHRQRHERRPEPAGRVDHHRAAHLHRQRSRGDRRPQRHPRPHARRVPGFLAATIPSALGMITFTTESRAPLGLQA